MVKNGTTSLYTISYMRDSLSRITVKQETIQGSTQRYNYYYDIAGRLKEVKRNDTSQAIYNYDANGNRFARVTPITIDSGKYDAQDRLLNYSSTRYFYTSTGNLSMKIDTLTGDTTRYSYDAFGSLVNVRIPNGDIIEYIIDASNRRVGKKINGVVVSRMLFDSNLKPVAELDSAGNIATRYIYAAKENVPEYLVRGGIAYRVITDNLGSPRLIVDATSGAVIRRTDYDEWGNVTSSFDSLNIQFGFAGGLYDSQTKLVRFGVRDYEASTGRWTRKDPIRFEGGVPNLYSHVNNDPINGIDYQGTAASGMQDNMSLQQSNQQAQKQAKEGMDRTSSVGQYLEKHNPLKKYPTKPNRSGTLQPYNPKNGQYLGFEYFPVISPVADFGIGCLQALAEMNLPDVPADTKFLPSIFYDEGYQIGQMLALGLKAMGE